MILYTVVHWLLRQLPKIQSPSLGFEHRLMEKSPFTAGACHWKKYVRLLDSGEGRDSTRPISTEHFAFDWNLRRNMDIKYDDPGLSYVGSIWVLSRLTHACGSDGESSPLLSSPIKLNVPDTIFFKDGQPTLWLCTLEGKLDVHHFERQSFRSNRNSASQTREDTGGSIQSVLDTMLYFWNTTNNSLTHFSPTCVVSECMCELSRI